MRYVDIRIPANDKGKRIIGCLIWLLARMVLQMHGTIRIGHKWGHEGGLFFYRELEKLRRKNKKLLRPHIIALQIWCCSACCLISMDWKNCKWSCGGKDYSNGG